MCMSVGEHPKNEDLRVHRQPSEEVKNEQKESNKEFEISISTQLTELPPITYIISGDTIKAEKTEEKTSEKDPTHTPSSETQPENLNNESKLQEENSTKIENETTPKDDIKPNDASEQKSEKEDKPSFRENMSESAKGFGSKICSFFSTAIEVVKQLPQATREIIAEIKTEKEYEAEKERILGLAEQQGIPVPEGTRESKYNDSHIGLQTLKTELWKDISKGQNNTEQTHREQSIADRVNSLPGADRPVFSPVEIISLQIVDQEPQELTNERFAIFNNFESMYTTIETITSSNPDVSISPEALREIEAKYAIEIREGSSYTEIHGSLIDDIHTLMEEAYLDSIRAKT